MFGLARISSCPLLFASQSYRISLFRCVLFSLIIFCNSIVVNGQAPANIATDLVHWYRASSCNCASPPCLPSDNVLTISPTVTTGNATASASGVSFDEASFNFNPSFVLSSGYLQFARAGTLDGDFSAFIVLKSSSSTASGGNNNWRTDPWILGGNNTSDLEDFGITWDNGAIRYGHDENNENYVFNSSPMTFKSNPQFQLVVVRNRSSSTNDTISFFSNGAWMAGTGSRRQGDLPLSFTNFYVGQNQPSTGAFFDGSISEIIVYRNNMNNASRIRIESYLALKYGHTLAKNYLNLNSGGSVVYSKSGGFGNRIFGIGAESTSLFDQRISASADLPDLVMMNGNPSAANFGLPNGSTSPYTALANGQYQVIGDDGGLPTLSRNLGSGLPNMLGRTWKVTDVGAVGPVTLWFKQSTFTNLSSTENYFLVYGKDPNFGMGEHVVPMLNQGGPDDFTATVDFPNNDTTYFTIVHGNPTFPVFSGPAGVPDRLELWLRSEKGVQAPLAVTGWSDYSENGHHLSRVAVGGMAVAAKLNFHDVIAANNLGREMATSTLFRGRTILAVTRSKAAGGTSSLAGWNNSKGLNVDASNILQQSGANFWTNGSGTAAQNGNTPSGSIDLTNWSIITVKDSASTKTNRAFRIGEYQNPGSTSDSVYFAEILVYDSSLVSGDYQSQLESYLAIKYGITLAHDYLNSGGGPIYDITGYGNEILGIGRDDNGLLLQRQSRSVSPTGLIGIAMNDFAANDSVNTGIFADDRNFLIIGNDGAGIAPLCWTTDELNVSGEAGEHVRIQREWKLTLSGTWPSGNSDVKFVMDASNPSYTLPALPPGSTGYNMYLGTSPDFATGFSQVYPMSFAGGFWNLSIPMDSIVSSGSNILYFTFGAQIANTFFTDTVCPGGEITVFRSRLDQCNRLNLTDASFVTTSITSNQTSFVTLVDHAGGAACLDTNYYTLPSTIGPGTYVVSFDTSSLSTGCGTPTNYTGLLGGSASQSLKTIEVATPDSALISWAAMGDSVFCVGEGNVTATFAGSTSGSFFLDSTTNVNVTSILQLVPVNTFGSTGFGTLLVHGGITGKHYIKFVTNSGLPCKDSILLSYTINPVDTTTISYTGSPYCGGDNGVYTPNVTGAVPLSIFSASPFLADSLLDSLTGQPNIPLIPVGNYTITYTPPANVCATPSSTTITIDPAIRANFSYLGSDFCHGLGVIGPWISNRPSTGYFRETSTSPGTLVFLDSLAGYVDVDASPPNTYIIEYFVNALGCTYDETDTITIHAAPNTSFSVTGGDTICVSGSPVVLVPSVSGGTFYSLDGRLNVANNVTNSTVAGNTSFVGGPFYVYYRDTATVCIDSSSRPIWVKGVIQADIEYGSAQYCKNELDPLPQFLSGTAGGRFVRLDSGLALNDSTGLIDLSASNAGTHFIAYSVPDLTCPSTFNVDTIVIDTVMPADFLLNFPNSYICSDSSSAIFPSPPSNSSFSLWRGAVQDVGAIVAGPRLRAGLDPGLSLPIRNIRTTGVCRDTAFQYIDIFPSENADIAFIPSTICVGDMNPFPIILGTGGGIFTPGGGSTVVDSSNGTVTVTALGVYSVTYTTQGACPSIDSASVTVADNISAFFEYNPSSFCTSSPIMPVPDSVNLNFGVFSVPISSSNFPLDVDSVTGRINLLTAHAGSYSIRFTVNQAGSCYGTHTQNVTIYEPDISTQISITPSTICQMDTNIAIHLVGDSSGIFSADNGLVFFNSDLGIISINNSVIPVGLPFANFQVTYSLPGECLDRRTADITILRPDDASFYYPNFGTFCSGSVDVLPTISDTSLTGTFSMSPQRIGFDPQTGELYLSQVDSAEFVSVTYTTQGVCPNSSTQSVSVQLRPSDIGVEADPGPVICVGDFVEISAVGTDVNQLLFYRNSSDSIVEDQYNFHIFSDVVDIDTFRVRFITQDGCEIEDTLIVRANPIPTDSLVSFPEIVASNEPYTVILHAFANGTTFDWKIRDIIGEITFDALSGVTSPPSAANSDVPITQNVVLASDFNPATFTYVVRPVANGCKGAERNIEIKVNPNSLPVFIPQVFTPDGNNRNETWLIQWKDGIDPRDYTIKLYNDAGALLKTMNPLIDTWNGEGLPDGVYWYILYDSGDAVVEAGGLTIRRK